MEEAAELRDYLPLSFTSPKEQEYVVTAVNRKPEMKQLRKDGLSKRELAKRPEDPQLSTCCVLRSALSALTRTLPPMRSAPKIKVTETHLLRRIRLSDA